MWISIYKMLLRGQQSKDQRARRRAAKKRKRKFARFSEGLRVQMVHRRKEPPRVEASSSAPPLPCGVPEAGTNPFSSSSLEEESSSYKALFPSLAESCKNPSQKELRRSARHKGKA